MITVTTVNRSTVIRSTYNRSIFIIVLDKLLSLDK